MTEQTPRAVGTVSTDGQFEWDGSQWVPRGSRGPSAWTRPMQLVAAVYLVVLAVTTVTVNAVLGGDPAARLQRQYEQAGIATSQAGSMAHSMAGVLVAGSLVFAVVYLLLAAASVRGWGWVFWVDAFVLLIGSFNVFGNLGNVADPGRAGMSAGAAITTEVVAVCALLILCWFVVSLFRFGFGAWARPRRAQAGATG